jgi:hypothetical protein
MGERRRRIDKVLDPEFLVDLPAWPIDGLRRQQAECLEVEESRLTRRLAPSMAVEWRRGRETLITDATLAKLPNLDDDELRSTIRELGELEHGVSQQRRDLHRVIDRMEGDLAARHKVGQA